VWTFVAVAYDQPAGTSMLYVNGQTYTGTASNGSGWNFTRIGSNPSFGEYFSGTIDNVFFYSSALTASELDAIRINGVSAVPEPSTTMLLLGGVAATAIVMARRSRRPARSDG
jgi:hypothetical protein